MPTEPIITTGTIVEVLSDAAYRTRLPNGKVIIAHPSKDFPEKDGLTQGTTVTLEMTPYDFEKGRIAAITPDA